MSEIDRKTVGETLPLISSVKAVGPYAIEVAWNAEGTPKSPAQVDLAPAIFGYKYYRPLRDRPDLFETVHVIERGTAIAWGKNDAIEMAATTVAHLADEVMQPADFAEFLRRNGLTLEGAAAQLGISRRLVAYYASERQVPRYIALACAYLDHQRTLREARNSLVQGSEPENVRGPARHGRTKNESLPTS